MFNDGTSDEDDSTFDDRIKERAEGGGGAGTRSFGASRPMRGSATHGRLAMTPTNSSSPRPAGLPYTAVEELQALRAHNEALQKQVMLKDFGLERLRQKVQERALLLQHQQAADVQQTRREASSAVAALEEENAKLRADLAHRTSQLHSAVTRISALKSRMDDLLLQNDELQQRLDRSQRAKVAARKRKQTLREKSEKPSTHKEAMASLLTTQDSVLNLIEDLSFLPPKEAAAASASPLPPQPVPSRPLPPQQPTSAAARASRAPSGPPPPRPPLSWGLNVPVGFSNAGLAPPATTPATYAARPAPATPPSSQPRDGGGASGGTSGGASGATAASPASASRAAPRHVSASQVSIVAAHHPAGASSAALPHGAPALEPGYQLQAERASVWAAARERAQHEAGSGSEGTRVTDTTDAAATTARSRLEEFRLRFGPPPRLTGYDGAAPRSALEDE